MMLKVSLYSDFSITADYLEGFLLGVEQSNQERRDVDVAALLII